MDIDVDGFQDGHQSLGEIDRLEVENFKSYKGHQRIGPFKKFTAIIGPNGSGKSNLMDAISFVLGVKSSLLRGSIKELLYSYTEGGTPIHKPTTGYVKLVFKTPDDQEVEFSRVIKPGSRDNPDANYVSQYMINNKDVSWADYAKKLSSFGVLVKVKNFLVFQGDIEAVASKSPEGLTDFFEKISGSDEYKKKYAELEEAKKQAEDRSALLFSRKKAISQEKKQKKDQKDEAERHMRMEQELRKEKTQYYLFQLYQLDREIATHQEQQRKLQDELDALTAQHHESKEALDAKKREQAGYIKQRMGHEKQLNKIREQRGKLEPQLQKAKEELRRAQSRVSAADKEAGRIEQDLAGIRATVLRLEQDLEDVRQAQARVEQDVRDQRQGQLHYSEADEQEYQHIKSQVESKTGKLKNDRSLLEQQQQADRDALRARADTDEQQSGRIAELQALLQQQQSSSQALEASIQAVREQLASQQQELADKQHKQRKALAQRDSLARKLADVEEQLGQCRASRKSAKSEERFRAALAQLMEAFPGQVFGTLTDLCSVSSRKYHQAVELALGKNNKAVAVADDGVAHRCVELLKRERLGTMTFLPVNSVQARPVDERLRNLGGSARVALDLVHYEAQYERVFLHALGATVITNGRDEANHINMSQRVRVVCVDGTKFDKSGYITGGAAGQQAGSAFDKREEDALRTERDRLRQQQEDLPNLHELRAEEQQLAADIAGCQEQERLYREQLRQAQAGVRSSQAQLRALQQQQQQQQQGSAGGDSQQLQERIEQRAGEISELSQRINEVTDRLFRDFSRRLKVANIREYEEKALAFMEQVRAQQAELTTAATRNSVQLEYEQSQLAKLEKALAAKQSEGEQQRRKCEELAGRVEGLQQQVQQLEEKGEGVRQQYDDLEAKVREVNAEYSSLKKAAEEYVAKSSRLCREVDKARGQVEACGGRQVQLLQEAAMEQVRLPGRGAAAAGNGDEDEDGDPDDEDDDEGEAMEVDGEEGSKRPTAKISYKSLKRQYMAAGSERERQSLAAELRARMAELQSQLDKSAPNMKAVEQYNAIREKEKEQDAALAEARRVQHDASAAFNDVRQRRHDLFMRAFDHISGAIDDIYKQLTKSSVHTLGGQAYLALESAEEPYLHGIKYTAMPPTKRFRDMEQLSGGEKTLAALALLFAVHSYRPSPFFVLDEVDAALDATNVARVAHYIRNRTRDDQENSFQSIVISLKDIFYEKADALVGVCRDQDSQCSQTFTFDLNRFDAPLDAE